MGRLEGKVAVILGAASEGNMGQTIARRFAREGARTVVAGRKAAPLEALAAELDGRHAICDITRKAEVEAVAKAAVDGLRARRHRNQLHGLGPDGQATRDHRGADRSADGTAVQGAVFLSAGVRGADVPGRRRLDHHDVLGLGVCAPVQPRGLYRHEGGHRRAGALLRERVRRPRCQGQLDCAGAHGHANDGA